ncbi:uncharacterized protein [Rutidosis leptorrhynchoides]|uniref:uncharacterized protein n=1 Tax=Rutidosis leptorrhynchoides TaxID=125765 RepID=UPI003A9A4E45
MCLDVDLSSNGSFGMGRDSKFGDFEELCRDIKPNIIDLQETKLHCVNNKRVCTLCGSNECDYLQKEMVGKFGGQLIIWDTNFFHVSDSFICDFFIDVRGTWKISGNMFTIINVYGSHNDSDKKKMWHALSSDLRRGGGNAFMLCGDFNEVLEQDEMLYCEFIESRAKRLNDFISSNYLMNLLIGGHKFTHDSDDGIKYIELDGF